jgi:tetratricopeptide (TPR) repeat protein
MANADEATFTARLPRLTIFLAQRSVLMVLDNLESLLRENGNWRDARWEKLIAALLDHRGQSRLVLTSRVRPQPLHPRVLALPVHSLTLGEAALLARQSRNLGRLLRDPAHRPLVIRTLKLVQGHPELLKLAEAQASSPERLTAHLGAAEEAATAGAAQLEAFFQTGESALDAGGFLGALHAWTKSVSGALPEPARILFHRLCSMEEEDREKWIIEKNWGDVASPTRELAEAGLVDSAGHIHPGVAEAGREQAGSELRESVDVRLASFWIAVFQEALEQEGAGMGELILRAGRSAAPYLMRQRRWKEAGTLLEQAIARDHSPATVAGTVPLLQRIAEATEGTVEGFAGAGAFASALRKAGRTGEAVAILGKLERQAAESSQYRLASAATGELANLLRDAGHLTDALTMVERKKDHTRMAGLGPWTQLGDEARRLQILNEVGHHEEVLDAVKARREEMKGLPESSGENETVEPWLAKEGLLDIGRAAALRLQRWQEALSLNEEVIQVTVSRGATDLEVARTRCNDYGPLLRLQRYSEARRLLHRYLAVFESAGSTGDLGTVHSAIADLEFQRQHFQEAVRHESTALRLKYSAFLPQTCAMSHFNLANYLIRTNADARLALAHRLASVLIFYQTNDGELPTSLNAVREHLALVSSSDTPASFDELCRLVEQTEGVRFRGLFSRLPQRAASGDEALRTVLEMARASV